MRDSTPACSERGALALAARPLAMLSCASISTPGQEHEEREGSRSVNRGASRKDSTGLERTSMTDMPVPEGSEVGERRWPVALTILVAIALFGLIPDRLTLG